MAQLAMPAQASRAPQSINQKPRSFQREKPKPKLDPSSTVLIRRDQAFQNGGKPAVINLALTADQDSIPDVPEISEEPFYAAERIFQKFLIDKEFQQKIIKGILFLKITKNKSFRKLNRKTNGSLNILLDFSWHESLAKDSIHREIINNIQPHLIAIQKRLEKLECNFEKTLKQKITTKQNNGSVVSILRSISFESFVDRFYIKTNENSIKNKEIIKLVKLLFLISDHFKLNLENCEKLLFGRIKKIKVSVFKELIKNELKLQIDVNEDANIFGFFNDRLSSTSLPLLLSNEVVYRRALDLMDKKPKQRMEIRIQEYLKDKFKRMKFPSDLSIFDVQAIESICLSANKPNVESMITSLKSLLPGYQVGDKVGIDKVAFLEKAANALREKEGIADVLQEIQTKKEKAWQENLERTLKAAANKKKGLPKTETLTVIKQKPLTVDWVKPLSELAQEAQKHIASGMTVDAAFWMYFNDESLAEAFEMSIPDGIARFDDYLTYLKKRPEQPNL